MDEKGQVSMEYLISVLLAVALATAAAVIALNLTVIAQIAKTRVIEIRETTISSLLS